MSPVYGRDWWNVKLGDKLHDPLFKVFKYQCNHNGAIREDYVACRSNLIFLQLLMVWNRHRDYLYGPIGEVVDDYAS